MFKNLSAKYYQGKEKIQKKACERYQNFYKEEKEKKRQYSHAHNKNLWVDEKEKVVEYRKKYYRIKKKKKNN